MATYTLREITQGLGITKGHGTSILPELEDLVNYAAEHVGWNRLSIAPEGFAAVEVETKKGKTVERIHQKSGVKFNPGFHMCIQDGDAQKWEGKTPTNGTWAYRLDLQGITDNGANFSIQTNGTNSKTVAVCMMQLNKSFSRRHLVHALKLSASSEVGTKGQICDLTG